MSEAQAASSAACQRGIDASAAPEAILQAGGMARDGEGRERGVAVLAVLGVVFCEILVLLRPSPEPPRTSRMPRHCSRGGSPTNPTSPSTAFGYKGRGPVSAWLRSERVLSVKKEAMGAGEGARHVKSAAGAPVECVHV